MRYSSVSGTWELDNLPGCTQVCVSHSAFVLPELRGTGHGKADHEERLEQISELKYNYALATTDSRNERQNNILIKNGWRELDRFMSSKTQHNVIIWGRLMHYEPPKKESK